MWPVDLNNIPNHDNMNRYDNTNNHSHILPMAKFLVENEKWERAIQTLEFLKLHNECDFSCHLLLAEVYISLHNYSGAILECYNVIKIHTYISLYQSYLFIIIICYY